MIRDPDAAVAASICYLARTSLTVLRFSVGRHPRPCGWCDYDPADLLRMIVDFNRADSRGELSAAFRRLSPNAQRSLVETALYHEANRVNGTTL